MYKLINYLPPYLHRYKELLEICEAESPEISNINISIGLFLNNQFIETLTECGCDKWERFLKLEIHPEDDLELRRFRIKSKLLSDVPYTEKTLRSYLTDVCGENRFTLIMRYNDYAVEIWLDVRSRATRDIVIKTLKQMLPANLDLRVQIDYRSHEWLQRLRHTDLRPYSHNDCRTIVLGDEAR